jgi:hypothetical protein
MATKNNVSDQFANIAYLELTQTLANTIEFKRLDIVTGALLAAEKKYGLIIHRAEYFLDGINSANFATEAARLEWALCVSPNLANLNLDQAEILDAVHMAFLNQETALGTIANGSGLPMAPRYEPIVHDFDTVGGLLIPADRLYLGINSSGLAAAGPRIRARLWYTTMTLSSEQYWELIEARRIIST